MDRSSPRSAPKYRTETSTQPRRADRSSAGGRHRRGREGWGGEAFRSERHRGAAGHATELPRALVPQRGSASGAGDRTGGHVGREHLLGPSVGGGSASALGRGAPGRSPRRRTRARGHGETTATRADQGLMVPEHLHGSGALGTLVEGVPTLGQGRGGDLGNRSGGRPAGLEDPFRGGRLVIRRRRRRVRPGLRGRWGRAHADLAEGRRVPDPPFAPAGQGGDEPFGTAGGPRQGGREPIDRGGSERVDGPNEERALPQGGSEQQGHRHEEGVAPS